MKEDKEKEKGEVSRRDFLISAGAITVGAAGLGALAGCGGGTETVTTTKVSTVPTTVTSTATTTTTVGAGETVTTTVGGGETITNTVTSTITTGGVEPWQEPEETHYMQLTFH